MDTPQRNLDEARNTVDSEKKILIHTIEDEHGDAKRQHVINVGLSTVFTAMVLICGGFATFFSATNQVFIEFAGAEGAKIVTAGLAFLTTLCGTFEKTFGFQKKASGYRDVKVRFENLRLDVNRTHEADDLPAIYDRIKEARLLKNELTK